MYDYDGLNRLLSANFKQVSSGLGDDSFNEAFTYDKMGNILTLKRKKNYTQIDDLEFHYSNNEKSNQLQYVDDYGDTKGQYLIKEYQNKSTAQAEFTYDANGNMTKDLDRDIYTIKYNVLNLPDVVQFKNGNQIKNSYNAGGQKLGTEYFTWVPGANVPLVNTGDVLNISYSQGAVDQSGTAHIGNVEYNTKNGNSSLTTISRIYNTEGYVENISSPNYYYYRKDHLGNNREVWLANSNSTVQRTQYYPSGLPMTYNDGDNPGQQRMKYNGKEFDEMHGYDCTDLGARIDYNAIMRSPTQDPHAENYYSLSPYSLCNNNPVNAIDPNGQDYIITIDRNGNNEITGITISATVYITGNTNQGQADDLNEEAKKTFKNDGDGTANDPSVSFNIKYKYVKKAPNKLNAGENLLTFSSESSSGENGHVESREKENTINKEKQEFTSNRGIIYANGNNRTKLHETGHLIGLPDRYDNYPISNVNWKEFNDPHFQFENDLMRNADASVRNNKLLNKIYYDQYIEKAKSYNPNIKVINSYLYIGYDKVGQLKSPYEAGGYHVKKYAY